MTITRPGMPVTECAVCGAPARHEATTHVYTTWDEMYAEVTKYGNGVAPRLNDDGHGSIGTE